MIKYTTKTTTAQETIINNNTGQIKIYTLKIIGETATENIVTLQNDNETIDKFILTSKGQIEGIKGEERPAYVINGNLNITCSSTAQIGIFTDYEII